MTSVFHSSWSARLSRSSIPLICSFLLWGCRAGQTPADPASATSETIEAPISGKKVVLATFSDRLLFKSAQHRPLIGQKYIVDYRHSDLTIYDSASLELLKIFPKMACTQSPTFLDDHTLLLSHNQNLVAIDLDEMEISTLAHLDAPLMTAPFVTDKNTIVLQYMNNIAQCFDLDGHSLWKTMLPYSASYYKQTTYAPCCDETSVYLAYPGGPLVKLNQKTGLVEWHSGAIADAGHGGATFTVKQLVAPLAQSDSWIFAKTSEHECLCINKSTGKLDKTVTLSERDQSYITDSYLYAMTSATTLTCYDTQSLEFVWEQELPYAHTTIVGQTERDPTTLFLWDTQNKLLALDAQTGELTQTQSHKLQAFDIFTQHDDLYAFNAHGTLIKLNIPSSMTS